MSLQQSPAILAVVTVVLSVCISATLSTGRCGDTCVLPTPTPAATSGTLEQPSYLAPLNVPQTSLLFPVQSKSTVAIVHLKPTVLTDLNSHNVVRTKLAHTLEVVNPPYLPKGTPSLLTLAEEINSRLPYSDFYVVVGVATNRVQALLNTDLPLGTTDFRFWKSADKQHTFPATGGDLFFHIKAGPNAQAAEATDQYVKHLKQLMDPHASSIYTRDGFNGPSGRNQFGYFDAGSDARHTANPVQSVGPLVDAFPLTDSYRLSDVNEDIVKNSGYTIGEIEASLTAKRMEAETARAHMAQHPDMGRVTTAVIADGQHGGGSFAIWQEFEHNLEKFNKLSAEAQDHVFGRHKGNGSFVHPGKDVLGGSLNKFLPRAHVVRAHVRMSDTLKQTADLNPLVQNDPGSCKAPLQIDRQAFSFKEGNKKGLAFVAYARDTARIDNILSRMIGESVTWPNKTDNTPDALLTYTKAVQGQYFYIPSVRELQMMGRAGMMRAHYDVAIVGGGVSGVYSAWKLKQKYPDKTIAVFERTAFVGGRLQSYKPQNTPSLRAELGGMRVASTQTFVPALVKELGLRTQPFYVDEPENPALVRGKVLTQHELTQPKLIRELYNIKEGITDEELGDLFGSIMPRLGLKKPDPKFNNKQLGEYLKQLRKDLCATRIDIDGNVVKDGKGHALNDLSIHTLFERLFGNEAFRYQQVVTGYYAPWGDWNAVDAIVDNLSDFGKVEYTRLADGYETLPITMAQRFTDLGGQIHFSRDLRGFSYDEQTKSFDLEFQGGEHIMADKLILAMPRAGLERLESLELSQIADEIQSINPRPFFKYVMVYEKPWWGKQFKGRSLADTPIRQAYYWGTDSETGHALVMTYNDGITVESWQVFSKSVGAPFTHDWNAVKAPETLVEEQHRQFCELHGKSPSDYPMPVEAAFIGWHGGAAGGGVNFWRPSVNSTEVIERMKNPIPGLPLHIVGSAYSNLQGWVEGAITVASEVLHEHFGIEPSVKPCPRHRQYHEEL